MVEADQSYHPQIAGPTNHRGCALGGEEGDQAQHSARGFGSSWCRVPVRDITAMAKAMVMERRDEFLAKAKASSVVQDELRRLQAKEERKRQRQLERNSKHLSNSEIAADRKGFG